MKALSNEQMDFFRREGYLMVPDVFERDDLTPLRDELTGVIDSKARALVDEGKLSRPYEEEPFERRLTRVWNECPEIMEPLTGKGGGGYSGAELFHVITHRKLLAYIEDFVGPEIVGSSVYRIRPKIPFMDRGVVPWHQDSGYFEPHCDRDLIVTVWMPLVDATPENGCLQVLPRAHEGGVYRHWTNGPNGYLAIADEDLPPTGEPVTVPVPLGECSLWATARRTARRRTRAMSCAGASTCAIRTPACLTTWARCRKTSRANGPRRRSPAIRRKPTLSCRARARPSARCGIPHSLIRYASATSTRGRRGRSAAGVTTPSAVRKV